ncbi:MAG: DNA polymerase III subunit delta [Alphaproteobacteria bacterium]
MAILVYGPDRGLVRERLATLTATVLDTQDDPFRLAHIDAAALREDPARLSDEARALAFGGGRRVVRLRDVGAAAAGPIGDYLAEADGALDQDQDDALILVEGTDLGPRSKLRQLFEKADNAAALPCYAEEGADLERFVRETLAAQGVAIDADALAYVASRLGNDRGVNRGETEKLALYAGTGGRVSLADATQALGDSAAVDMEAVVLAAGAGDAAALDRAIERAFREGVAPIAVLRTAQRHFQRLHLASGLVAAGKSADQAMAALRPPVFFKVKTRFRGQIDLWPPAAAGAAMMRLGEAEMACKEANAPAAAICARALMQIATLAAQSGRTRGRAPGR